MQLDVITEFYVIPSVTCPICNDIAQVMVTSNVDPADTVCESCADAWNALDETTQEHLTAWYNTREEDITLFDCALLARLVTDHQWHWYACAHCDEIVRQGQPDD